MISGGEQYVASLLFHELAHQKLYIKGDSEFSEAFATVIEEFGTERWLMAHGTPADLDRYRQRRRRGEDFAALIAKQQARLREIYARDEPPESKRERSTQRSPLCRRITRQLKARWGGNTDYDAWFAQPLNNAALAAVATYTRWVPVLRARLDARGLDAFYADTAALAKLDNEERAAASRGLAPGRRASASE